MKKILNLKKVLVLLLSGVFLVQFSLTAQNYILNEDFSAGSLPAGWLQTDVTFATVGGLTVADYAKNTGKLTTSKLTNPKTLTFSLGRTTNATDKTMKVNVSTTQNGTYTTIATFNHANTTSGGYITLTVDLTTYSSSEIYLQFEKSASTTSNWRIDWIKVETAPAPTCTASNLAFAQSSFNRLIADGKFIPQTATSLNGTTAISYSSSDNAVATVNATTGEVTPLTAGSVTITATQAAGTHNSVSYCDATATYTLNVTSTAPTITVTEVNVPAFSAYSGETDSEAISVSGANLTENIALAISGTDAGLFSLSANSVSSTANNVVVTIYYNPVAPGTHTATLTLSSAGATSVTRTLNGTSSWRPLTTPVATAASNITNAGFTANWDAVVGATQYEVNVIKETTNQINATDLFISEYVEGSSNNKYIEIYNGTGSQVDLSNYQLGVGANGSSTLSYSALSGTLDNGAVLVLKNSQAALTLPNGVTATNNGACSFTGNDAVVLSKISPAGYVDVFGRVGNDPGTSWTSTSNSTADKTLVRKSNVTAGITTSPTGTGASAFTTLESEWTQYNQDVVSNLGSHTMNSTSVSSTPIAGSPFTVTGENSKTLTGLDAGATYKYTVTAKNANVTSSVSNTISVTTSTGTGVALVKNNAKIYTVSGKLIVEAPEAATVAIYNAVGQLVDTKQAQSGKNTFTLAVKGILFVKSNNQVTKVIL